MASSLMDWTPTNAVVLQNASSQGNKRTHDYFNQQPEFPQPFNPYAGQYMPGGWPASPGPGQRIYEDRAASASSEAVTSPLPANIIIRTTKRICLGIASRFATRKTTQIHRTRVIPKLKSSSGPPSRSPKLAISSQPASTLPKTPQSPALSTFLSSNVPSTPDPSNGDEERGDAQMRDANQKLMNKFGLGKARTPPGSVGEDFESVTLRCADWKLLRRLGLTQSPTPPESPKFEPTNNAPDELGNEAVNAFPTSPFTPPATPPAETAIYSFFRPAVEVLLQSPYPVLIPSLSLRPPFKFGQTPSPEQRIVSLPRSASGERASLQSGDTDQPSKAITPLQAQLSRHGTFCFLPANTVEQTPPMRSKSANPPPHSAAAPQTSLSEQHIAYSSANIPDQTHFVHTSSAYQTPKSVAPLRIPRWGSSPSAQLLADMSGLTTRDRSPIIDVLTPDPYHECPKSPPMSGELSVEQQSRYSTRSIAKQKADAAKQLNGYHIEPLSKEWEAKVEHALKHGHGSYSTHDLIKVVPPLGSKTTSQWLNDETINGYLKLVTDLGNQGQKAGATPKYHAFTSFFMTTLLDKGYDGIKRWSKRAKIDGKKLYDVQDIFIPINRSFHWTVLVVSPKKRAIHYYDSLGGNGRNYVIAAMQWLRGELSAAFAEGDWMIQSAAPSPLQDNSSDCGVFAITTAKQLMLGRSPMAYGAREIPVQRRRIVAELIAGKLL